MHLTMMRACNSNHRSAHAGRGLQVKVNLPTFKDEKSKDVVTYCSWWWAITIFGQSGWDDQHLLPYIFGSLQGFLGNLARSLVKDATMNNVVQMLGEHYGVLMMFNTLIKELYSLKQGSSENIAEFGVCLLHQVQILQSEYPGRIQLEHVEEMKYDCFYEGLNPKYQHMLAHKVDGEHLVSYSNLLLAALKLERQEEARDPLLPKMAITTGSYMMHSQMPGNLFPWCKLKGNHTFAAQAMTVRNDEAKTDQGVKLEGEGDMEPSVDEDAEASNRGGETNQPVKYIFCLLKQMKYIKRKTRTA